MPRDWSRGRSCLLFEVVHALADLDLVRLVLTFAHTLKILKKNKKMSYSKAPLLQRVLSIRKVSRVNSGGKIRSTSALVVVGDRNGHAGYGMGRGADTMGAVEKATTQAKANMKSYPRLDNRTIFSNVDFKFHGTTLQLKTAKPGRFSS